MRDSASEKLRSKYQHPLSVEFVLAVHPLLSRLYRLAGKPVPPIESLFGETLPASSESGSASPMCSQSSGIPPVSERVDELEGHINKKAVGSND